MSLDDLITSARDDLRSVRISRDRMRAAIDAGVAAVAKEAEAIARHGGMARAVERLAAAFAAGLIRGAGAHQQP
jgi:hypothetical protein